MGKLNLKLMQGIEKEEAQLQKDKQVSDAHPDKSIDKAEETQEKSGGKKMSLEPSTKAPTNPKKDGLGKSGAKSKKKEKEDKKDKQVFSFRASLEDIAIWKAYGVATDIRMEKIASQAMTEFVNRHKLSGPELAVFEALLAREKK